jgi:hypothetical protein
MSRFNKYIAASYPWTIRTEKSYQASSVGSYFFTVGYEWGFQTQEASYQYGSMGGGHIKNFTFNLAETGYSVHDVRSFINIGNGHWAVAVRLEHDSGSPNYGAIYETRDWGQNWVIRYSPTTGWTGSALADADDVRSLVLGNDGLVYAAMSTADGSGILRFNPDNTDPPEWCTAVGPFTGDPFKCYGIVQDSSNLWYLYTVLIPGYANIIITSMNFVASTEQTDYLVWVSPEFEPYNDEYIEQRDLAPMVYSSVTNTIWALTKNQGIWYYDITAGTWTEYLISTDFITNSRARYPSFIQLDSAGDPEWICCRVSDDPLTFAYYSLLKRVSGNLFECYLFDE